MVISVSKNVEKLELLYTVGGKINDAASLELLKRLNLFTYEVEISCLNT